MSRRLIVLVIIAVSTLTACGRAASTHSAAGGYLIFLEGGFSNSGETVKVVDSGTGTLVRELPIGTPNSDWSRYYIVVPLLNSTELKAIDPASGRAIAQTTIADGYSLPNIGFHGPTAGLSPNGQWLTLTSQRRVAGATTTNFLVGSSSLTGSFKTIHLDGDFVFDALSNNGQRLYLIRRMSDARHYQVRLYDLAAGRLLPQPVVDKREPNEPMTGIRGDSAADPAGNRIYTVYARDTGPFIHALSLDQPFAFCVDLPKGAAGNIEQQFHWSLAITPDGSTVYAVNGALGKVSLIKTAGTPTIVRTAPVALRHSTDFLGGLVTNADAKGPILGGAALSFDSATLFAFGETGVLAIDGTTLKVRARYLDPMMPDSMRLSSDGKWLYVAEAGASKLWQIDPVTGAVGEIQGVANPWALFWAEPKKQTG